MEGNKKKQITQCGLCTRGMGKSNKRGRNWSKNKITNLSLGI
jgi:hypothetical protein